MSVHSNLQSDLSQSKIVTPNIESQIWQHPFPNLNTSCKFQTFEELFENSTSKKLLLKKSDEDLILEKSLGLEQKLSEHIFGQQKAVRETANALVRFAAGINDRNTVIASLLYCGPSGVGKTELAKQLCLELYGDLDRLIRIKMSEYAESHSIYRLIGAPPGYLGYQEGGQLVNALLKAPYSIVLIDEIEKADPKVLKLFLHIFDAGYFNASNGKVVDCRKAVFISTSNLAAMEISSLFLQEVDTDKILELLKPYLMQSLSPELYNRFDTILFSPLSFDMLEQLVNKVLNQLYERVYNAKKIQLIFDPSLIKYLIEHGFDPELGARPLKRLVEKELATIIAKVIVEGKCKKGDRLKCSYYEGCIFMEKI